MLSLPKSIRLCTLLFNTVCSSLSCRVYFSFVRQKITILLVSVILEVRTSRDSVATFRRK